MKTLSLSKVLSIRDVILKLEIFPFDVLEETANKVFAKYKKQARYDVEPNETSVAAMCLYFAGKIEKIKVAKNSIQKISNLSMAQWRIMEKLWNPWASTVMCKKKLNQRKIHATRQHVEEPEQDILIEKKLANSTEESYDDWAIRIVKKARQDMRKWKNVKVITIL